MHVPDESNYEGPVVAIEATEATYGTNAYRKGRPYRTEEDHEDKCRCGTALCTMAGWDHTSLRSLRRTSCSHYSGSGPWHQPQLQHHRVDHGGDRRDNPCTIIVLGNWGNHSPMDCGNLRLRISGTFRRGTLGLGPEASRVASGKLASLCGKFVLASNAAFAVGGTIVRDGDGSDQGEK
ncbi:uncharacterized protein BDR25DRAFT_376323 [Lindgomyces ingoldianus]|uniref:Uncharacterized protein n=1 Tax=Lindgomyces ingoldianus TaxID=673940 RepID=A0ACB6QKD8_9PLEO|nr:uncharacterized protein BDR25DRAFT_376323 [Lindgomyces ingoldianus]KAF2467351.1 hypothetical protein BDR25DRAFT_376323 [Lindgomyces ingoldianus]